MRKTILALFLALVLPLAAEARVSTFVAKGAVKTVKVGAVVTVKTAVGIVKFLWKNA